jgi:FkbM family methyltransferase
MSLDYMGIDYSQSDEQAAIFGALAEAGVSEGRFLDIGAGDGETYSNTRALALAGWQGVCVEPAAWAFAKLLDLYDGTDVRCCSAVVTAETCGPMTFLYTQDDHLSTVEPEHAEVWSGVPFKTTTAAAFTVAQLLDWFELGASVVSIDAEGRTNEIVRAYSQHPAWEQVDVICYEREDFRHAGATHLVPPFQLVAETPNNLIYRRAR